MVLVSRVARWIWFPLRVTIRFLMSNGKRIAVSLLGLVLVLAGLAMLVLPGPGVLLLIAGLAVLATEYVWAQRMLNYAKRKAGQARDSALGRKRDGRGPDIGAEG
jgi:uncharacterized protein (TIGR02611 family)